MAETMKEALDTVLSPTLFRFGVVWRGDYTWVEPGERKIRRIIRFTQLKGSSAVITWGLCVFQAARMRDRNTTRRCRAACGEIRPFTSNPNPLNRNRLVIAGYFAPRSS